MTATHRATRPPTPTPTIAQPTPIRPQATLLQDADRLVPDAPAEPRGRARQVPSKRPRSVTRSKSRARSSRIKSAEYVADSDDGGAVQVKGKGKGKEKAADESMDIDDPNPSVPMDIDEPATSSSRIRPRRLRAATPPSTAALPSALPHDSTMPTPEPCDRCARLQQPCEVVGLAAACRGCHKAKYRCTGIAAEARRKPRPKKTPTSPRTPKRVKATSGQTPAPEDERAKTPRPQSKSQARSIGPPTTSPIPADDGAKTP